MNEKTETRNVELVHPKDMKKLPVHPASGSRSENFTNTLAMQVINTLWTAHSDKEGIDKQMNAALTAMMGIKPKDEAEGMLAAQMVAAHNAAMECYRRAMLKDQGFEYWKDILNQANKLTRSYAVLMETLTNYRGKPASEQKVTVQHVHVSEGGQAIVGNVAAGGRGE